ncbi:MAG: GNAT family N-acetyltransferase [Deltaproteobacteria bacterium]|nr:GNAT family N-acetyltransferase [Deltaproteobacteria bacterium]
MAIIDERKNPPEHIEAVMRNGLIVRIRPIRPSDKKMLEGFFYRMTPLTRYYRFHYAKERITEEDLILLTEVTPPERFAYVAVAGTGEDERITGVGRWDMTASSAAQSVSAEIAFTVEDQTQIKGIGTILLEELVRAALGFSISRFIARVLPENTRMLEVFEESGFKFSKRMEESLYVIDVDLTDQDGFQKRQAYREHVARSEGVRKLLSPKRAAVVGASRNPESVGGAVFRNMLKEGFNGVVFPVNPNADSIAGVLCYPSVMDIPGNIDLGVIIVPAAKVMEAVEQCAKKGAHAAVIISAGFSEAGAQGVQLERGLIDTAASYGLRLVGPNCLGVMSNNPAVRLNATFSPVAAPQGNLSIGSQSGALGLALIDHANSINLGIEDFVSIGNRADISNNDLLEFWEDDANTGVIVLYLESFGNPRKFARIARRVTRKKPIIAVKSGRSAAGARAAGSHTGALAAPDAAVDALFRQAGVIRVNSIQAMFNAAEVLTNQPLPKGPRVGILTNAGGPGVMAADACDGLGLKVLPLSKETQAKLKEFLPASAAVTNPVDMIASARPESFGKALAIMLDDPEIDSVMVIYIPPLVTKPADVAEAIKKTLTEKKSGKPVLTCFMMSAEMLSGLRKGEGVQLRPFIFPEDAAYALALSYEYAKYREAEEGRVVKFTDTDSTGVKKRITQAVKSGWLMPEAALGMLNDYGLKSAQTRVAFSPDEAAAAAQELGFPVVVKLRSGAITHKTDVKGVVVGLMNPDEVRTAFAGIKAGLESQGLGAAMEGVLVQKMYQDGTEMIVGMSLDPVFGPVIMTGFGGVSVELIKDVTFSIHPLLDVDPEKMLRRLKSVPLLLGWRGKSVCDVAALKDALLRLSALVEDFPEIEQLEINPLLVLSAGQGCVAVDARVMVR